MYCQLPPLTPVDCRHPRALLTLHILELFAECNFMAGRSQVSCRYFHNFRVIDSKSRRPDDSGRAPPVCVKPYELPCVDQPGSRRWSLEESAALVRLVMDTAQSELLSPPMDEDTESDHDRRCVSIVFVAPLTQHQRILTSFLNRRPRDCQ